MASSTLGSLRAGGCPTPATVTWSMWGISSAMRKNVFSLRMPDFSPRTANKGTFFKARNKDHSSVERPWSMAKALTIFASQSKRRLPSGASR